MVQEKVSTALASTVLELQRERFDPQRVLSNLVDLHRILSSSSSSPLLSLPAGPSLSDAAKSLHQLLQDYLANEEEVIWYLCRVVSVWSRSCHRFKLEAGHIRIWKTLKAARAMHPDSPRVLETSLDATIAIFEGVELHQMTGSRGATDDELVDEMLLLIDRFNEPPVRAALLSPHYDFSKIVVLALDTLTRLFQSARVTLTSPHGQSEQLTRHVLERLLKMLPHFLKSAEASRAWLRMCCLQLQYSPPLALRILFHEALLSPSWCQQLTSRWRNDSRVTYDFVALFTHTLAVPQGSKILPAAILNDEISRSVVLDHRVLGIMIELLGDYSGRLQDPAATPADRGRVQPIVLEIVRAMRQLSSVPDMLATFPNCITAKKSLVSALIVEITNSTAGLRSDSDMSASQYHMRVLLELVLTIHRLVGIQVFARSIKSVDALPTQLSLAAKRVASLQSSVTKSCPYDAGDGDLPAVLHRELNKAIKAIAALPAPTSTREKLSSASRGLHRLPSSSSVAVSRQSSINRTTLTSSTLSLRRTPSSSSSSSLTLIRTNSQHNL